MLYFKKRATMPGLHGLAPLGTIRPLERSIGYAHYFEILKIRLTKISELVKAL